MDRSLFGVRINPAHSADQRIAVQVKAADGGVIDSFQMRGNVRALSRASGDSFDVEADRLIKAAERQVGSKMYVEMVRYDDASKTFTISLTGRRRKN